MKKGISLVSSPIIIGGCGRSGTTLLLAILSAHDHIFGIPFETEVFIRRRILPFHYVNGIINKQRINHILHKYYIPSTVKRYCEKTPKNIRYFDLIMKEFSNKVKLIQIVRDGIDVVTSILPSTGQYHISINRWIWDVSIGLKYRNSDSVMTIRYEDLITNYYEELKKIFDFIEEDLTKEVIDFQKYTTLKESNAWHQGGKVKSIYKSSIGRWKSNQFKDRIADLMSRPEAVKLLKAYNYL